jgi:zinc/manganese transport system substrate-binding protein
MPRRHVRVVAGLSAAGLALGGCAAGEDGEDGAADSSGVRVVASTTFWGDIVGQVVDCAGSGSVSTLMPVGADPHDYSASSKDVAGMAAADLVVANGLGLEEGLVGALDSAESSGVTVLELAPLLDPVPLGEGEAHDHAEDDHPEDDAEHSGDDPHVWLDASRAAAAATLIGDALARETGDEGFATCGATVSEDLMSLDAEVADILAVIPAENRVMVTDHEAFGYFAQAYGLEIAGVVIPGGSTLAQPNSAEMAALTATIRETGVPAVFANSANSPALVEALAEEVGAIEVVELYVGSLGEPGSGADSYQAMMRTDAQRIADALASSATP